MATLSRAQLKAYDSRLARIEAEARDKVVARVKAFMDAYPDADLATIRNVTIDEVERAVALYGDAASTEAADLYDDLATASKTNYPSAETVRPDYSEHIVKEVKYQVEKLKAGDANGYRRMCGKLASDEVSRVANETMRHNAARHLVRFARVPQGAESCKFCAMLASRGYVYHSEITAGEGRHWHKNCRCKVVPNFKGLSVEGYDPKEWERRWRAMEEIDAMQGLSDKAKRDARLALSEQEMRSDEQRDRALHVATQRAWADTWDQRMTGAWDKFKPKKTPENYDATIGKVIREIGESTGVDLKVENRAKPNGDEIWAAVNRGAASTTFRYDRDHTDNIDCLIDGDIVEIKTPESRRNVARRLTKAHEQFKLCPGKTRRCLLSMLKLDPDDLDYAVAVAQAFIDQGKLDCVTVLTIDGETIEIE